MPQEGHVLTQPGNTEGAGLSITGITAHLLRSIVGAVALPDQTGLRTMEINSVLVEVETSEGITGLGESFYRSLDDCRFLAANARSLGRHLIGKNPLDVQQRWHEMYVQAKRSGGYAALSAFDEALWDIKGKVAGRPVYDLLGGKTTPVRPYATFPIERSSEQLVEDANWLRSHGYLNMKIAVGHGVEEDRRHIRHVVERLPNDFTLAIDANTTYSFEDAFRLGKTASELELLWFEEPVEHFSIERNAELNNRLSVPIAGYQTYTTHTIRRSISCERTPSTCINRLWITSAELPRRIAWAYWSRRSESAWCPIPWDPS